jgi:hypothetical protein
VRIGGKLDVELAGRLLSFQEGFTSLTKSTSCGGSICMQDVKCSSATNAENALSFMAMERGKAGGG